MKVKIFKIRISDQFLTADQRQLDSFFGDHNVIKFESAFVQGEEYWSVILYYEEMRMMVKESKPEKFSAEAHEELSADEVKILDSLKLWRSEKAREQSLPVYFIATNKELLSIAKYKPAKKEELKDIKGFGKHKIENYGEEIIEILETV